MIQDASYQRVGQSKLSKVGVVAVVGALAAVGMYAFTSQQTVEVAKSNQTSMFI